MTEQFQDAIREYLRSSEEFRLALEVRIPPEDNLDSQDSESVWDSTEKKRFLAIVTHLDTASGDEQGCIFIFRLKHKRKESAPDMYILEHVFPILGRFSITMAQPRRNTMDLSPPPDLALNQPRTEFTLTINPGHDMNDNEPIVLLTRDTVKLKEALTECKRLREISVANNPDTLPPYAWIVPYTYTQEPSILSPIPADLRHAYRPLQEHLSPASAGQPGDDVLDISFLREEWIKQKVHEQRASTSNKFSLRIRLGTFNVNGKMPSQDLSPWVRGHVHRSASIAPPKNDPPLSIGETTNLSVENYAQGTASNKADTASLGSDATAFSSVSTSSSLNNATTSIASVQTAGTAVPNDTTTPTFPTESTSTNNVPASASYLSHDDQQTPIPDPDVLVLAFQELDLSAEALLYSTKTAREEAWYAAALAGLGEKAVEYEKLTSKQLVGMLLVLVVKKSLRGCFDDVRTTSVGAGILGLMGNKGGTAIRFTFAPPATSDAPASQPVVLTFVNAHLAAFDEMYDRRNADFHDLSKRLQFDSGIPVPDGPVEEDGFPPVTVPLSVYQTDALFWLGDLNYRINLADADIRSLLSEASEPHGLQTLLKFDQLGLAIRTRKAFVNFVEADINYVPSYRYASGSLTDSLGYDMKRKPAWTDRILYMPSPTVQIQSLAYTSHPELTMSDHKPVTADVHIHIPMLDSEKLDALTRNMWREVTNFEHSDEVPKLQVSPLTVDFGEIYHKHTTTRALNLQNVGKVPCTYRFVPISSDAPVHPDWLRIESPTGLLLPGETSSVILVTVLNDRVVGRLNGGPARLNDTLILHTLLGKDHFVSITAHHKRTCFATSLDRLVRLPGPVRNTEKTELLPEEQILNAPREIMRLVNWLMSNGTNVPGLFLSQGDEELVAEIRECLDTGEEFATHSEEDGVRRAVAFATCLIEFLDSLPEPVIPADMHARCAQVATREQAFELLDELPSASVNVWISVTAFLHFISQQVHGASSSHTSDAGQLASIFAPVLLRDDLTTSMPVSPVGKQRFVQHFVG